MTHKKTWDQIYIIIIYKVLIINSKRKNIDLINSARLNRNWKTGRQTATHKTYCEFVTDDRRAQKRLRKKIDKRLIRRQY